MEQQILRNMFRMLNESLNESPDGEITIENLTPLENKIKHLRTVLKETNARILYLQSVNAESEFKIYLLHTAKLIYSALNLN